VLRFRIAGWQELVTVKSIGTVILPPEHAAASAGRLSPAGMAKTKVACVCFKFALGVHFNSMPGG